MRRAEVRFTRAPSGRRLLDRRWVGPHTRWRAPDRRPAGEARRARRRPGLLVLTQADLGALLGVEETRETMGCAEAGCLAELAGALGADRVVHGSLGRVGGSLVVNLSALDPRKASAPASVSARPGGDAGEAFLDALPGMVSALLTEEAPSR